jgi:hypothetical protein
MMEVMFAKTSSFLRDDSDWRARQSCHDRQKWVAAAPVRGVVALARPRVPQKDGSVLAWDGEFYLSRSGGFRDVSSGQHGGGLLRQ